MSKFMEKNDIDSNNLYDFVVDKKIKEKFYNWVPIFTAMLVEKAFETNGNVKDCNIVMAKSNEYRQDQDYISQFCSERIYKR